MKNLFHVSTVIICFTLTLMLSGCGGGGGGGNVSGISGGGQGEDAPSFEQMASSQATDDPLSATFAVPRMFKASRE